MAPRAPIAVWVLSESPALSAASVSASGSGSSARRRRCHTRSSSATGIPVPRDPHKASRRPGRNSRAATNRLAQTSHVRHVPPDQTAATDLPTKAVPPLSGVTSSRNAVNHLLKSVVREIRTPRSVGTGGGRPPPVTRWMWKRSHGRTGEAPPDEKGRLQICSTYSHRVTSRLYATSPFAQASLNDRLPHAYLPLVRGDRGSGVARITRSRTLLNQLWLGYSSDMLRAAPVRTGMVYGTPQVRQY